MQAALFGKMPWWPLLAPGHFSEKTETGELKMWKIVVGFILFAALTMFVLFKGGEVDMGGEKHGADAVHAPAPAASAPAPAPAAQAASAPASAAASAAK